MKKNQWKRICGLIGMSISIALLSACAKTEENRNTEIKMETETEETAVEEMYYTTYKPEAGYMERKEGGVEYGV